MGNILTGVDLGKHVHRVEDHLIGARMLGWMTLECNKANWWCVAVTSEGKLIEWDWSSVARGLPYQPERVKRYYAIRVVAALNQLDLGGVWFCAWIDDCKRFYLLWKDDNGDIQIPIECDKSWLSIRDWEPDTWCNMAVHAWGQWREHWDNVELKDAQTYNLAAGERPPSQH